MIEIQITSVSHYSSKRTSVKSITTNELEAQKKGPRNQAPLNKNSYIYRSSDKGVIIPGPIGKYGGIQQLTTTGAFPGIERSDKIIKLLGKHTASATWTVHGILR